MSDPRLTFVLTDQHLTLLRAADVQWDETEFGAPAIDPKRPYGNGDVVGDMARLLGVELPEDAGSIVVTQELTRLHAETKTALQIVLGTGRFEPGTYVRSHTWSRDWRLRP